MHVRLPPGFAANAPSSRPSRVHMAHYKQGKAVHKPVLQYVEIPFAYEGYSRLPYVWNHKGDLLLYVISHPVRDKRTVQDV